MKMPIKPTNQKQRMQKLTQFIRNMFASFRRNKNIQPNNHAKCGFILRNELPLIEDQEEIKSNQNQE